MTLLVTEDGRFRIQIRRGGHRVDRRLPVGTTQEQAEVIHARLLSDLYHSLHGDIAGSAWETEVELAFSVAGSWAMMAFNRAKRRDPTSFELTLSDLKFICLRSGGKCEVTGLKFSPETSKRGRVRPYFQSLDRIDSSKGYSLENCRLICAAVNIALSVWGEEVFREIAVGYAINRYCSTQLRAHIIPPKLAGLQPFKRRTKKQTATDFDVSH